MSLLRFAILAIVMLTSVQPACAEPAEAPASGKYWVYVGTYTSPEGSKGIYRCEFDVKTGVLGEAALAAEMTNPSFLAISPNKKFLYAVGETDDLGPAKNEGSIVAFKIDPQTGALTKLNTLTTGGAAPCHVSVNQTNQFALVANYTGGSSAMFRLSEDGSLAARVHFRQHLGSSINKERQEKAHGHCAMFQSDGQDEYAYVVDLGLDRVFSYKLDAAKGELVPTEPAFVKVPDGSGPRHIAFNSKAGKAYVCGELASTLITLRRAGRGGILEMFGADGLPIRPDAVLSTLPPNVSGDVRAKNSTAEVLVHPAGGHVLVSNRGHDSLAVFEVNADISRAVGHIEGTGDQKIRTPRGFNIDPTGRWVLIGNQDGHSVFVAEWSSGSAKITSQAVKIHSPVCIKFLPKP